MICNISTDVNGILSQFLLLIEKPIIYAKITVYLKKNVVLKLSFKSYRGHLLS